MDNDSRFLGWISVACSAAALFVPFMVPLLPRWSFGVSSVLAVIGVITALAGIDSRRSEGDPKSAVPLWGIGIAVLATIYGLLGLGFISIPIHM